MSLTVPKSEWPEEKKPTLAGSDVLSDEAPLPSTQGDGQTQNALSVCPFCGVVPTMEFHQWGNSFDHQLTEGGPRYGKNASLYAAIFRCTNDCAWDGKSLQGESVYMKNGVACKPIGKERVRENIIARFNKRATSVGRGGKQGAAQVNLKETLG